MKNENFMLLLSNFVRETDFFFKVCLFTKNPSGGWHENKMVLVSKIFKQSEPAKGRVAQWRGPGNIFAFITNMAKLSFNGGSEDFLEYLGLIEVSQHFLTRKRKLVLPTIFLLFDCQKTNGFTSR